MPRLRLHESGNSSSLRLTSLGRGRQLCPEKAWPWLDALSRDFLREAELTDFHGEEV